MPTHRPLVAVTADLRDGEDYRWHAAPEPYLRALARVAGAIPLIVPSLGPDLDARAALAGMDALLTTGARSNVHPDRYGAREREAHAPFDPDRDATSLALIAAALEAGLPVLAICRGMQELNVALGGTLAAAIQDLPGRDDHRAREGTIGGDARFALSHEVAPVPGGRLAALVGNAPFRVNSLHGQAIDRLAPPLAIEARAPDGTVEAVSRREGDAFVLGVQWHPEYWAESDAPSRALFEAFGRAARERAALTRPAR